MTVNQSPAPTRTPAWPAEVEETAGLLQSIAEAARQMALLTVYVNALRDGDATFAQLRPHLYQALALGQRMLHAADAWAPAVIGQTAAREGVTLSTEEVQLAAWALRHVKGWPVAGHLEHGDDAITYLRKQEALMKRLEATS